MRVRRPSAFRQAYRELIGKARVLYLVNIVRGQVMKGIFAWLIGIPIPIIIILYFLDVF